MLPCEKLCDMAEEPKQDRGVKEIFRKSWGTGKEFSRQNPTLATLLATLVASLLYLYVTGIGLFYSWFLYRRFGINIFDYSESSDFLLAALKNPGALILIAIQAVGVLGLLALGEVREGEGLSTGTKVIAIIIVLSIATAPVLSPYGAARKTVSDIKEGYNPAVDVQYRTFSS